MMTSNNLRGEDLARGDRVYEIVQIGTNHTKKKPGVVKFTNRGAACIAFDGEKEHRLVKYNDLEKAPDEEQPKPRPVAKLGDVPSMRAVMNPLGLPPYGLPEGASPTGRLPGSPIEHPRIAPGPRPPAPDGMLADTEMRVLAVVPQSTGPSQIDAFLDLAKGLRPDLEAEHKRLADRRAVIATGIREVTTALAALRSEDGVARVRQEEIEGLLRLLGAAPKTPQAPVAAEQSVEEPFPQARRLYAPGELQEAIVKHIRTLSSDAWFGPKEITTSLSRQAEPSGSYRVLRDLAKSGWLEERRSDQFVQYRATPKFPGYRK